MQIRTGTAFLCALAACAVFVVQGYVFIRQVGPHEREVEFAASFLEPKTAPLAPKALLYRSIFRDWPPDVRSLRIPALALGAGSLLLCFAFLTLTVGPAAASLATLLLAADSVWVVSSVVDFQASVVPRFLWSATLAAAVGFRRTQWRWLLGTAGFAAGLAIWDRPAYVWVVLAWLLGGVVFFRSAFRERLTRVNAAVGLFWLAVGMAPLLRPSHFSEWARIWEVRLPFPWWKALDGSGLFGFLAGIPVGPPAYGDTAWERTAIFLSGLAGHPEHHLLLVLMVASLASLAVPRGRAGFRVIGFCAATAVLCVEPWPLPQMMVATTLAALPRPRWAMAAGLAAVAAGMLVTLECYSRIVRFGPAVAFTDAAFPLREALAHARTPGIFTVDPGIVGPMRFLGRGALPLRIVDSFWEERDPDLARKRIDTLFHPPHLAVLYADRRNGDSRLFERLMTEVRVRHLREDLVEEIRDSHGRRVYRLVRYVE